MSIALLLAGCTVLLGVIALMVWRIARERRLLAQYSGCSLDWITDCLSQRGRVLTGVHGHWCPEWDDLPMDEYCFEWPCGCSASTAVEHHGRPCMRCLSWKRRDNDSGDCWHEAHAMPSSVHESDSCGHWTAKVQS